MRFLYSITLCSVLMAASFAGVNLVSSSSPVKKPIVAVDSIVIEKKKRLMTVYYHGTPVKSYKVALGFCPTGHKEKAGDGKTPEGIYSIAGKNPGSQFNLSLRVSYPSAKDQTIAKKKGVNPGGDIMIHGLGKGFGWLGKNHALKDWTLGCIAVTNEEIEELYPAIAPGTKVDIRP